MKASIAIILLGVFLGLISCETESILVPDNTAPSDPTVSNALTESYINKVYISLLGRKATDTEFSNSLNLLKKNNLSQLDREAFINSLFSNSQYKARVYELEREILLQGASPEIFFQYVYIFERELQLATNPVFIQYLEYELERVRQASEIGQDYIQGTIDLVEIQRRCVNNFVYDEINMGTENFVISVFQNFLFRIPTDGTENDNNELENSKNMVDGNESILFLEVGSSKEDFLNIFFNSNSYFEGQVRTLFDRYLYREPTSYEMLFYTTQYKNNRDYEQLQRSILTSDEYIGIE
jgi:hypothetical protein